MGYFKLLVCAVTLVGLTQAALPQGLFGKPLLPFQFVKKSIGESAKHTRSAEQQVQDQIQSVVNKIKAAAGSPRENADLSRRDVIAKSVFSSPLRAFNLAKQSLSDSVRKTRAAEEQIKGHIQDAINQINAATGAMKEKANLARRDVFANSLFNLLSAKKTRAADEQLQDKIQDVINKIDKASGSLDSDTASLSRRDGQVFGLGGSCGQPGDTCSGFTTHCCDPWECKRAKWFHVSGTCQL